ncbi:protein of unknown function (DUF3560) [Shewanella psychrophila]|uniref:Large polyvalent protein associated domain-containing protein n=1 Tax=Shewanella psychrophila TaxID=225848 RepID=A0A1S6HW83_9GAMM|nr:DUF3560 domain-containing protein [Shewanella psychrophila]AQS39803.1 protein of unknown function (DUF3560) [Shewanella psychrophila]
MTHSTQSQPSLTNQTEATNVSPLDESGSSKKNVILSSFTSGKLRKNAKQKIASLLSVATGIKYCSQSMGMDDCYRSNAPVTVDADYFWTWYEKEYSELTIYLTVLDGVLTQAVFSDCMYHFSDDIILTFDECEAVAVESEREAAQVPEPVVLADIAEYQLTDAETVVIQSIEIDWSESNLFTDGEVLTLSQYNDKATAEALEIGRGEGYAKTKINVLFDTGEVETRRHDIDADYPTLTILFAQYGIKAVAVTAKELVTYDRVKAALVQGYLSPLNHDRKQPEPTPPSNTRKVVSLGDYQARIDAKKDRFEARASKANEQSNLFYQASRDRASHIPFGQPILVGHHSEGRARRDADRIWNDMGKSVQAQQKAEYLEGRAESVGTSGIASDDIDAIEKLNSKLEGLEQSQATMKAINKVVRSKHMSDTDKIEYMANTHKLTEVQAKEILAPDFAGRVGFAHYQLTNNGATIRATKQRIDELKRLHEQAPLSDSGSVDGQSWTLFEEEGRIKFKFDGIPSEAVRNTLKSNGFKWSRYSMAWVRKITANATAATQRLVNTWG